MTHSIQKGKRVNTDPTNQPADRIDVYRSSLPSASERAARTQRPCRRLDVQTHVLWEEILLYAPATETAFALNPSAKAIWELCDGTRTISEIGRQLRTSYALSEQELVADVTKAVAEFIRHGLLEPMGESRAVSA
jgi:hypothetical protein